MAESSETEDLAQDYIDEDPRVLSDEQLRTIGKRYGMSLQEMKALASSMTKNRNQIDPLEIQR